MIYLHVDGEEQGPFTTDELRELWDGGPVTPEAYYWYRGMKAWTPVAAFEPPDPAAQKTPAFEIKLTTAPTVAGAVVETELDIITAECVVGISMLGDL